MEDLLLKGQSLGLQSCFLSFPDSEKVKSALGIRSPLTVTAIAALGYGLPRQKKLRVNSKTMGCVDIIAQRGYYAPKKDIRELAFVDTVDNIQGLDERIGFCEDPLWQGLYGVSKAPSYLNRQPYAFLLRERDILLVRQPDPYTDESSFRLDLGMAMLHFTAAAEQWGGRVTWSFQDLPACSLPAGYVPAALCRME